MGMPGGESDRNPKTFHIIMLWQPGRQVGERRVSWTVEQSLTCCQEGAEMAGSQRITEYDMIELTADGEALVDLFAAGQAHQACLRRESDRRIEVEPMPT